MNALAFVPALIVLLSLGRPSDRGPQAGGADATDPPPPAIPAASWRSAWRYASFTPPIRATLVLAVGASASFNIAVVMPLMVSEVFRAGGETYGALAVAFGLGALPGALLSAAGPVDPRSGEVRTLALALAAAVVLAALAPTLPSLFAAMALVGAASMWFIARANAFVMLQTPAPIRGRVMGIWTMAMPGSNVVTGLLVGALADAFGPRVGYGVIGIATAAVAMIAWRGLRSV
ncbi:MFS transporter [Microbacterium sp. NIBRBAC000506063]|nr:MFS transporter [Microbacterium sp. NIBRBAC000506063]